MFPQTTKVIYSMDARTFIYNLAAAVPLYDAVDSQLDADYSLDNRCINRTLCRDNLSSTLDNHVTTQPPVECSGRRVAACHLLPVCRIASFVCRTAGDTERNLCLSIQYNTIR